MRCENPVLIQDEDQTLGKRVPLFLIHDGGGTVFSYFLIGALDRCVHGISNPHFGTNLKWKEGIPGIAKVYAQMIKDTIGSGSILLGGWSLGGLISIEIAHIFSQDPDVDVAGIIMIDSLCPSDSVGRELDFDTFRHISRFKRGVGQLAKSCMLEAFDMVARWKLPVWDGSPNQSFSSQTKYRRTAQMGDTLGATSSLSPPTILLRAVESYFSASSSSSGPKNSDRSETLGWNQYNSLLLKQTFDIPGNHFSLFEGENAMELTKALRLSCDLLTQASEAQAACEVS